MRRNSNYKGMYNTNIYTFIFLLFLLISLIPALSQAEPYWVEFLPGYIEGTQPIMTVSYNDDYLTTIELTILGMWVEDVEGPGGVTYQKLEIPEYGNLMNVGEPSLLHISGLVGYLEYSATEIDFTDNETIVF